MTFPLTGGTASCPGLHGICWAIPYLLAKSTIITRSRRVNIGRFFGRPSTINCWRRRAFSYTSSDLGRIKSATVFGASV